MRRVTKRKPGPAALLEHREGRGRYADLPNETKGQVRDALLEDQGFLCGYCMRSIHPGKHRIRIEHHQSQSSASGRALDWGNLLATCSGAPRSRLRSRGDATLSKVPRGQQTCDRRKGDEPITINPLTPNVDGIEYLPTGRLRHRERELQVDIDDRLNLNATFLVEARKSARDDLLRHLRAKLGARGSWTKSQLQRYLHGLRGTARLAPFVGILEHDLNRRIARCARR